MFRMWGKIIKNNNICRDYVAAIDDDDTRTHKVFRALAEICSELDLENPIWLDANIKDFKRIAKTRFLRDSFIESVDFDSFEIEIIEE